MCHNTPHKYSECALQCIEHRILCSRRSFRPGLPLCHDHTTVKTKIVPRSCPYHQRQIDTSSPGQQPSDSTHQDDGVPISRAHDSHAPPMQPPEPGRPSSTSYQPPRPHMHTNNPKDRARGGIIKACQHPINQLRDTQINITGRQLTNQPRDTHIRRISCRQNWRHTPDNSN
ncbi:hypothetical protein OCU04_004573 [Sclerotinia nivalis]|uniref:Uncharacterized protein n=1 Tax=Sclerotinia nivalis TaxID=352851 RepID=A0A9X0ARN8_9HELO|nr:hypothetical protein OCU04_004573 [Sclerotinia nivalis]